MRFKKYVCTILIFIIAISCCCISVSAKEMENEYVNQEEELIITRATGRFSMDVSANTIRKASASFPLDAGEVVTIKGSYSPFSANVDFGLIASNGRFYYVTVTNGNVDQKIKITERGNYTFAVRNNSSYTISVSGYVNY